MTTPITRPCPHCGVDYDITRRLNGDQCWCPCGKWFRVVCRLHGQVELAPCEPPPFLGAQEPTEAAALVAEMSAMRAELEAAREDNAMLLAACRAMSDAYEAHDWSDYGVSDAVYEAMEQIRALIAKAIKE